jgi:hypothetical protein
LGALSFVRLYFFKERACVFPHAEQHFITHAL